MRSSFQYWVPARSLEHQEGLDPPSFQCGICREWFLTSGVSFAPWMNASVIPVCNACHTEYVRENLRESRRDRITDPG